MTDLATLKPAEAILDIVHPATGEKLGITVSLLSLDDPALKKLKFKFRNDASTAARKGKPIDAEKQDENETLLLFTAMTGWTWADDATFNGTKPVFNQDTVNKVFDTLPWFRAQIAEKVGDTSSFFTT